jgi:hypothetical protein
MSSSLGRINGGSWTKKTSNGLTWRLATENDLLAIGGLYADMEARLGEQDRPDFFSDPVVLTLVAEDETGTVVSALYGETTIELTSIGLHKPSIETISEIFPDLKQFFADRFYRVANVFVYKPLARLLRKFIPGCVQTKDTLARFTYRIR